MLRRFSCVTVTQRPSDWLGSAPLRGLATSASLLASAKASTKKVSKPATSTTVKASAKATPNSSRAVRDVKNSKPLNFRKKKTVEVSSEDFAASFRK